jgi:hypothetical protein
MTSARLRTALLAALGAATLGGCAYSDGYGYGYGVSAGYGTRGGGCDPYYGCDYGYGGYDDYGYGDPWYGWYNGFYYPGIGIYIFDQWGRRYRWNDDYRRYWEGRRGHYQGRNWNDRQWERWDGYRNRGSQGATPDRGNWQDRRGRAQYRDNRSSAEPWNEHQGQWRQRSTQAPQSAQQPQSAQPAQPAYPRGNWGGGRRGGGEGRSHGGRSHP